MENRVTRYTTFSVGVPEKQTTDDGKEISETFLQHMKHMNSQI